MLCNDCPRLDVSAMPATWVPRDRCCHETAAPAAKVELIPRPRTARGLALGTTAASPPKGFRVPFRRGTPPS